MILIFDTETTGKCDFKAPPEAPHQPRCVQLAAMLFDPNGEPQSAMNFIIRPQGFLIPKEASDIHGITNPIAQQLGIPMHVALQAFHQLAKAADVLVAFNIAFDELILRGECHHAAHPHLFDSKPKFCAMLASKDHCRLPGKFGDYKWPKLQEAHRHFFGTDFEDAHDAFADVRATGKVYFALKNLKGVAA